MVRDHVDGTLKPADEATFKAFVPELFAGEVSVDFEAFSPLIDSSDIQPDIWETLARIIYSRYQDYDGFVILHGTDTMAYSASALSFMLSGLSKPVVFTGSQLPVGVLRSDAKENLLTAIEIAAAKDAEGRAMVPEVSLYFEDRLFRGNRTTKRNAEYFSAFNSYNYPWLAKAGVHITYAQHNIHYPEPNEPLTIRTGMDPNVAVLRLFPGITASTVSAVLHTPGVKGVVLETFGSGNAPSADWLYDKLRAAVERGVVVVSKTQCNTGSVRMGHYATSVNLIKAGVLSGFDITTEALITKMMYLFAQYKDDTEAVKRALMTDLRGEVTIV